MTSTDDGTEPVGRDEYLYRRISASAGWYSPIEGLSPRAFYPRADDVTGLSVVRSKYVSVEQAARGSGTSGYYVSVVAASRLLDDGLTIMPRPLPENPGHVELAELITAALERFVVEIEPCLSGQVDRTGVSKS